MKYNLQFYFYFLATIYSCKIILTKITNYLLGVKSSGRPQLFRLLQFFEASDKAEPPCFVNDLFFLRIPPNTAFPSIFLPALFLLLQSFFMLRVFYAVLRVSS